MDTPVVLVVDDDEDIRSIVRDTLETEGYTVEAAANGIEALERLKTPPRPALILLDLAMPLMDGMTLLAELERRKQLAGIQVVVMTAASASVETSTLPYPLLRKPFAPRGAGSQGSRNIDDLAAAAPPLLAGHWGSAATAPMLHCA